MTVNTKGAVMAYLSVFLTDLGWCGLLGVESTVHRLVIGHSSDDKVRATVRSENPRRTKTDRLTTDGSTIAIQECDWFPELRGRLQRYAQGVMTEFDDIVVELSGQTNFQKRVVRATRRIKYGETVTYRQLAANAGAPKAARAVGNVMAANRFPIIVGCHRVVAAAGKLGGFSAPQGVSLKEQMLLMEAETVNR